MIDVLLQQPLLLLFTIVWTLPYSANLVLRQLGLVLFLAGIGTRAGYSSFGLLGSGEGLLPG